MSDLDRAREALEKAAREYGDAEYAWTGCSVKGLRAQLWNTTRNCENALTVAAYHFARAARAAAGKEKK